MTKTITIDGQEFELVKSDATDYAENKEYLYALKPIKPIAKEVPKTTYYLDFYDGFTHRKLITDKYNLDPEAAEAIAEAIKVLIGCITSDEPLTDQYLLNRVHDARNLLGDKS